MSVGEEKAGVVGGGQVRRRRRRWSEAQKRQIVAETHEPGVSVPMVAQRYNLNANQIFRWRRLFRESERAGVAGRFVPVVVEAAPDREPAAATMSPPSESVVAEGVPATGKMEIVLACDRRLRGRCASLLCLGHEFGQPDQVARPQAAEHDDALRPRRRQVD